MRPLKVVSTGEAEKLAIWIGRAQLLLAIWSLSCADGGSEVKLGVSSIPLSLLSAPLWEAPLAKQGPLFSWGPQDARIKKVRTAETKPWRKDVTNRAVQAKGPRQGEKIPWTWLGLCSHVGRPIRNCHLQPGC